MKLTEEQWRKTLSEEEFRVCRQKGIERPFTGELLGIVRQGDYLCTCCGGKLFSSEDKFESGCGWSSFSAQSKDKNVQYNPAIAMRCGAQKQSVKTVIHIQDMFLIMGLLRQENDIVLTMFQLNLLKNKLIR